MASDIEELASTVREYFVKNDGRVKLNDLFDHFRDQLDKLNEQGTLISAILYEFRFHNGKFNCFYFNQGLRRIDLQI